MSKDMIEELKAKIYHKNNEIIELKRKENHLNSPHFLLDMYVDEELVLKWIKKNITECSLDIEQYQLEIKKIEEKIIKPQYLEKVSEEKGNNVKNRNTYDYIWGWMKIKIGKEIVFSDKYSIKSISDYESIRDKIGANGTPTWLDTRLRRSLGMLYAILKTNSEKLNKKHESKQIDFMIDHAFWSAFEEFTKKFKNIIPAWNNKEVQNKPYEDCKVASNYVSALREILKTLTNIKIPDKWEKKDRNNPFFYSLFFEE